MNFWLRVAFRPSYDTVRVLPNIRYYIPDSHHGYLLVRHVDKSYFSSPDTFSIVNMPVLFKKIP